MLIGNILSWAKIGFTSNLTYTDRGNQGVKNTLLNSFCISVRSDMIRMVILIMEYAPNEYSPLGDFIPNQYVNNTKGTYIQCKWKSRIDSVERVEF